MEEHIPLPIPETHRFKGYVEELSTGVQILFPQPSDLWLFPDAATHLFLNRAGREIYRTMGREMDRENVKIVLIVVDEPIPDQPNLGTTFSSGNE